MSQWWILAVILDNFEKSSKNGSGRSWFSCLITALEIFLIAILFSIEYQSILIIPIILACGIIGIIFAPKILIILLILIWCHLGFMFTNSVGVNLILSGFVSILCGIFSFAIHKRIITKKGFQKQTF